MIATSPPATDDEGHCQVCLAGSTLARTFRCSSKTEYEPCDFPSAIKCKLDALDSMRNGKWPHAYLSLYGKPAAASTEKRLLALPKPRHGDFIGWLQFNLHLDSLEPIMYKLRAIELNTVTA